jgi:hypothetical protein
VNPEISREELREIFNDPRLEIDGNAVDVLGLSAFLGRRFTFRCSDDNDRNVRLVFSGIIAEASITVDRNSDGPSGWAQQIYQHI